jgi:DNA mismatch repair protein MutS2
VLPSLATPEQGLVEGERVNGNSFRTLEFETVKALLLSHAGSAAGRGRLEKLAPCTEPTAVREAQTLTREAVALLRSIGRQPYHDLPDIQELLPAARVDGYHLEPAALNDLASFIEGSREITARVVQAEAAPRLSGRAFGVADSTDVAVAIRRAVLPSNEVADDASPKLAEARRGLLRLRAQLQSVMEGFLRGSDADRVLQDKIVTTRNDRYVLLLKAEHRGQVPGIIHGSSGSGASLFVEPMPAVALNNDIVSLQDEERREVIRILRDLTARVGARADALEQAVAVLGELDERQAMALLARDMDAVEPEIVEGEAGLELLDARHPLLSPSLTEKLDLPPRARREPVPVTLRVGFGESVLVISGPNTGGKTVALKTAGLLALMAQCGLQLPAAPGTRLSVFRRIYADIGDEQSIAASLSTFSAHLANLVGMTRDLAPPALVLLDEVGAGTDPTEGGALGVAVVDHFRARGALVVATTHHGLLKAYAESTPGVACASFGYDPRTYEPTYRLVRGTAGRSLALEMAERLGLPAPVVHDARARLDQRQAQVEARLKKLEEDQAALAQERDRLGDERRVLQEEQARQRALEAEAEARRRTDLEAFRRDLRRRTEELARQAADAIHAAVQRVEQAPRSARAAGDKARTAALSAIREAEQESVRAVAAALPAEPEPAARAAVVGERARVKSLGIVGEVMSLHGDEAEMAVGGKRLRVPRAELLALGAPTGSSGGTTVSVGRSGPSAPAEINLVGLTVDEALPQVDKLLDDAALSDRKEIRVIHGFGEGKLRRAVADFLAGHPHVAAYRVGAEGRGGVTVVELKE